METTRQIADEVLKVLSADYEYVDIKTLKTAHVHMATVQEVPERKQIGGIWIETGRMVLRATLYFVDGTYTRTKSKHIFAAIARIGAEPIPIGNGFATFLNKDVNFVYVPTKYANGKTYDVISMEEVAE